MAMSGALNSLAFAEMVNQRRCCTLTMSCLLAKFTVSSSVLEGEGSSISFLKRKRALVPGIGTNIDKLVETSKATLAQCAYSM